MELERSLMVRPVATAEPVVEAIRQHETKAEDWVFREIAARMHTLYDQLNSRFFRGKLPRAVIAIGTDLITRYATYRIGRDDIGAKHRIHLNSRHFGRTESDVAVTLLHEMLHVFQHLFGKPGKRHRCHNREFVDLAARVGIESEVGNGRTRSVSAELRETLHRLGFSAERYFVPGLVAEPIRRVRRNVRWECSCGEAIWAPGGTTPLAVCTVCGTDFSREGVGREP